MTKVRVCVGVNKQGAYYSYGNITVPDKDAEVIVRGSLRNDPEVNISFHDLEVDSPQAPVVEALSSEGHTLKRGDLVEWSGIGCRKWRVQRLGGDNTAYITAADLPEVAEGATWKELEVLFPDGIAQEYAAVTPKIVKLLALAGQWHIADGEVVLSPPPQPEPEVKTKFQFGDLVSMEGFEEQYAVAHPTTRAYGNNGVSVVFAKYFSKLLGPATFEEMIDLFGYKGYSPNGEVDGTDPSCLTLIAPTGQWHINSSGKVVLKPKPEVTKPKFKRGDKVTRMQNGEMETWEVVEPVPNADGMIVLLIAGLNLPCTYTWEQLVVYFGEDSCGYHYRMSYEDDCTLVPEVTAPQTGNTIPLDPVMHYVDIYDVVYHRGGALKPGDMVMDRAGELWDVHDVSLKSPAAAWVKPVGKSGPVVHAGPPHTLKKVVFGTL